MTDLADITERSAPTLLRSMRALAKAIASGRPTDTAVEQVSAALASVMYEADLAGRRVVEARASRPAKFAADPILEDVMRRYRAWHAPTLARDISGEIASRIEQAFASGRDTALAVMEEINDWTVAYADTVYRTNVASAYSAGHWQRSLDPDIIEVIPAKMYSAIGDGDTRPNHDAADGLIAGVTDPIWHVFSPPMGFRCRCSLIDVDRFELDDRGLINADGSVVRVVPPGFNKAHPDPGFGTGRPDVRIYGR